ncbi:HPP family protein [candidate division KSB1 bacterium]
MSKKAKDFMTKDIILIDEDMLISKVSNIFLENNISCAPVVNKEKKLTGVISKTNLISYIIGGDIDIVLKLERFDDIDLSFKEGIEVSSIMTQNPITADNDTPLEELAAIMTNNQIHEMIIMENDDIVGIISAFDFLYYVAGEDKKINRKN